MKMIISLGYGSDVVMDHDDAISLIELLERAERYESKYRSKEEGGPLQYVYHDPQPVTIKHLPQAVYDVAKMAGRPPEKD